MSYLENLKRSLDDTDYQIRTGCFSPNAITMIHLENLDNIEKLFDYIRLNNIEGDFVETGVWRGGAVIFMAALNKHYGLNRKIFACDSYEGLPKNSSYEEDTIVNGNKKEYDYAVSLEEVKNNFLKYELLDDNVIFVKGYFEEVLSKQDDIHNISILRLDGDMYISTISVLESLYDKVTKGGVIIIDDYGWEIAGCKAAVDFFRKSRNIKTEMIYSAHTCYYWIKE